MAQKRMKLSQFAKDQGIAYITAYRHWQAGNIKGSQLPGGTILVDGWAETEIQESEKELAIVYSRVSSNNQKLRLKNQTADLVNFALEQGYEVIETVEEVGTAFSDKRTKLLSILHRTDWNILVVEEEAALLKFGYPYLEVLLKHSGREVVFRNSVQEETGNDDSLTPSGELELSILIKRVRDFMRPILGAGSQKAAIENVIESLIK